MPEDEFHPARLTLDEFQALTISWRRQARGGDLTTCMVADALESVLRRRIAEARAQQRAVETSVAEQTWWKLW
jgi:hypothetical protein